MTYTRKCVFEIEHVNHPCSEGYVIFTKKEGEQIMCSLLIINAEIACGLCALAFIPVMPNALLREFASHQ